MTNLRTLYGFEMKKIFKRKMVCIALAVMVLVCFFTGISVLFTYYWESETGESLSGYEKIMEDKGYAEAFTGRLLDDTMLQEMQESYEKYNMYELIYDYVYDILHDHDKIHTVDAESLYQQREKNVQGIWEELKLTEGEKSFWEEKEKKLSKPFAYGYTEGYMMMLGNIYSLNVFMLMLLAICLVGVFSEEHSRKTDQLILCSKYGRTILYSAKIAAGVTFAFGSAVVFFLTTAIPTFYIYGWEGFCAMIQMELPDCSRNISMGEAVLLLTVIYLIVSILYGIVAMVLSEVMNNSVAAMGLMMGFMMFVMMFEVPTNYRIISQIYELLPIRILAPWQFLEDRLIPFMGGYLTNFQFAPICYILISILLIWFGNRKYKRFQVGGR
ncbi:MAG: ABC transporter permease [Lachnospiraceae bacterium]|nr:ABC transporter permease [Lachnospiraceae bacterium]